MSTEFNSLNAVSALNKERNDCAVIAVACAARIGYQRAHALLAEQGRVKRRGTKMVITTAVLVRLGLKTLCHRLSKVRTQSTVLAELPASGTFLVRTNSHIFCVRDGVAHDSDWMNRRRSKVREVLEILALQQPPSATVASSAPPRKRGEVGAALRELIRSLPEASSAQIVNKLRAKFPESKADTGDVSVMRSRMKKEAASA